MLILQRYYTDGVPSPAVLIGEGMAVVALGVFFAAWLFPAEASLLCVFLAALSCTDSLVRLLEWNRREIFERNRAPWTANAQLTLRLLGLFIGSTIAFSALSLVLPLDQVEQLFSHQIEPFQDRSFQEMNFGTVGGLVAHNTYVLLFFFVMAIPFRHGGIMLAVAWNASVWGATFGVLARRFGETAGISVAEAYLRVMSACGFHMLIEAAAYTLAGLAGVFLSKGLLQYALDSAPLESIVNSVGLMLLAGFSLVVFGAVWEALLTPQLVILFG